MDKKANRNVSHIWNEGFEYFCVSENESSKRKEPLGMKLQLEKELQAFASLLKEQNSTKLWEMQEQYRKQ